MTIAWPWLPWLTWLLLSMFLGVRALASAETFQQQLSRGPLLDACCCLIVLALALALVLLGAAQGEP